mmetsp:Transcript_40248/g.100104  ORF Transcript_40248/g.100104 Transcript_40248/m.100104 type:complete len:90 (+) Transcript_40248:2-271(+)
MVEEAPGGLEKIEQLQNHQNEDIYQKAASILEQHFGAADDEEDVLIAPAAGADGYAFGVPAAGIPPPMPLPGMPPPGMPAPGMPGIGPP